MGIARNSIALAVSFALVACGGGGADPIAGGPTTPTPTPPVSACALSERQDFVDAVLSEWYLFPDLLATANRNASNDIQDYIDARVAPARAESKDRFFTFMTSIEAENEFFNSGSSAGFGIRLGYDTGANRVFVIEAYETAPAFPQGFDRGVELLAVGTSAGNLQTISSLMASGGPQAVSNALGPSDPGVTRVFNIRLVDGSEQQVSVTKAEFDIDPISDRYGAQVINDGGKKVGYVNLRTFIGTAEPNLRDAFNLFRNEGVTEVIVDVRYNGGGLVRIAELFGDLMAADKVGDVFSRTTLRPSKASENETDLFGTQGQAIAATKIAFITTGSSASASELVANAFLPYLGNNTALVGSNSFGKPVGQFAFDKSECDDRFRAVTFKTENADGQGEYFTGLASVFPVTCRASDDIFTQLGDPNEASVAQALAFLNNGGAACSAITAQKDGAVAASEAQRGLGSTREMLMPDRPTAAQFHLPGLY